MGANQKGQKWRLKYVMFTQSRRSTELLARSDCSEWLYAPLVKFALNYPHWCLDILKKQRYARKLGLAMVNVKTFAQQNSALFDTLDFIVGQHDFLSTSNYDEIVINGESGEHMT